MSLPPSPPFTLEQRDMQARGKDHYYNNYRSSSSSSFYPPHAAGSLSTRPQRTMLGELPEPTSDSFLFRERQAAVLAVLSDYDKLTIQAAASGVSIAAKRYELEAILCGLERPAAKQSKGKETVRKTSGRQSTGGGGGGGRGEGSGSGSSKR